ncbi:MAG: hypothetical protein ABR568_24515, partial [Pyrinomonadaceae bacterium]
MSHLWLGEEKRGNSEKHCALLLLKPKKTPLKGLQTPITPGAMRDWNKSLGETCEKSNLSRLGEEKRGNSERVAQMGWEQRGNNRYYYRKEREGPRVKSVYVGRGEIAQIVAQIQSSSAVLEKLLPLTRASRKDGMEKADAALKQASDLIDLITRSALI